MGTLSDLMNLLSEAPVSAILRERVLLLLDQNNDLEKRVKDLEEENARLADKGKELEKRMAGQAAAEKYTEHRGALFKRKPEGGYHHVVYCPRCKVSTFSLLGEMPFHCSACTWSANFTGDDLETVMRDLP